MKSNKLKKAMDDIRKILNRHDIGAVVLLHEPGYNENLLNLNPSYSCCEISSTKVTFKLGEEHYKGDVAKRDKVASETLNMISSLATFTNTININLKQAERELSRTLNAKKVST